MLETSTWFAPLTTGIVEYWNHGLRGSKVFNKHMSFRLLPQYSIIPIFHRSKSVVNSETRQNSIKLQFGYRSAQATAWLGR